MQVFLAIWLGAAILKLAGVPILKDVSWGWFVLAPVIMGLLYILKYIFYFAMCIGGLWCFYRFAAWLWNFHPII